MRKHIVLLVYLMGFTIATSTAQSIDPSNLRRNHRKQFCTIGSRTPYSGEVEGFIPDQIRRSTNMAYSQCFTGMLHGIDMANGYSLRKGADDYTLQWLDDHGFYVRGKMWEGRETGRWRYYKVDSIPRDTVLVFEQDFIKGVPNGYFIGYIYTYPYADEAFPNSWKIYSQCKNGKDNGLTTVYDKEGKVEVERIYERDKEKGTFIENYERKIKKKK